MWIDFKDQFMMHQNKYIPLGKKDSNYNIKNEWYGPTIGRALRDRNKLYKLKKANNDPDALARYNHARREVKKQIRQAKKNYECNIAKEAKNNPKKFYKYINSKKQKKSGIGPLSNSAGEIITDNKEMANTFNDYFSSVFTTSSNNNNTNSESVIKSPYKITELTVTEKQVLKKTDKMKVNKSSGPDNFYT